MIMKNNKKLNLFYFFTIYKHNIYNNNDVALL